MTRKDYKLIAKVFKDYWDNDYQESVNTRTYKLVLAQNMAKALAQDNPLFRGDKFMAAVRGV